MSLDFRNLNTLWAAVIAETLARLGLQTAIACPGSRSTPLTVAFAQHPHIETLPILDERSAAFFALGVAKQQGLPVVLICTSGTAGANFYPAVIEAYYSHVPLIVLTADRPPELRHCHAGQAINQTRLYGQYSRDYVELATPKADLGLLRYLRQSIMQAWQLAQFPVAGVVHLNVPFRDPLPPLPDGTTAELAASWDEDFFGHGMPQNITVVMSDITTVMETVKDWYNCDRGIIIGGLAQPQAPEKYVDAIAHLSQTLGFPVLAEGLSPLRNYRDRNPYLISTYDTLLRNPKLAESLKPDRVIQIGELPISKELRAWLEQTQPQCWIVDPHPENFDPLHGKTRHLSLSIEQLATQLPDKSPSQPSVYLQQWLEAEAETRSRIDTTLDAVEEMFEGKMAWLLSQTLPPQTPLFIANSMPVRDVEYFWQPNRDRIQPFFNRGANGIDGTLSTAMGIAHRNRSSVLLTGDLALLHDSNGFLQASRLQGHLTIILMNNNGGGIFEMLPIAKFDTVFEDYFATPQTVDFALLCQTHGVEYELISTWDALRDRLNPLPTTGVRLLEIRCDRHSDAQRRKMYFRNWCDS
ncbi:MAG: 2-succinyl-5-enolpyruvyl-6-hydroxy-3-cyclohexene-1-carboxylic-acid synthase [Spirulinaceae cyanobacterium]